MPRLMEKQGAKKHEGKVTGLFTPKYQSSNIGEVQNLADAISR